jgi:hypothetical protein
MSGSRYDRWSREGMPTGAEADRIQAGINATMADVVGRDARAPGLPPSPTVRVAGAVQVTEPIAGRGWANEVPFASPPGQDAIERLVNAALPPGPAAGLASIRAQIRALTPAQREQLLGQIKASNDPLAGELRALVEAER